METSELLSLISSIASLTLAIIAIWLSLFFYKQGKQDSQKTTEAANNIQNVVDKLQIVFDKMYGDTISMLKDSQVHQAELLTNALRSEGYNPKQVEEEAATKMEELINSLDVKVDDMLKRQNADGEKYEELKKEMKSLVLESVQKTNEINKEEEGVNKVSFRTIPYHKLRNILFQILAGKPLSIKRLQEELKEFGIDLTLGEIRELKEIGMLMPKKLQFGDKVYGEYLTLP